jgi:predicted permease
MLSMSLIKWFYTLPLRIRSIFKRDEVEQELEDELRYHLDMEIEENAAKGMSKEEARRSALLAIGGIDQKKEECRDTRGLQWLNDIIRDLSYGLRFLRRNPGFTALTVMTLALGIGSATAIFSLVNAALLKELPYKDAGRIIHVARIVPQTPDPQTWSALECETWKQSTSSCNAIAQFRNQKAYLVQETETPLLIKGAIVSGEFFSLFGVPAAVGSIPTSYEAGSAEMPSMVISHDLFRSRFGGNRDLIGQALRLDGMSRGNGFYVVAGVMPADFQFPLKADFWLPMPMHKIEGGEIIARLAPTASIPQVKAEFNTVLARLKSTWQTKIESLREYLVGDVAVSMLVLLGAVVLVMLIVCINVANLLLLRNQKRRHEMSVQAAIGATRRRLARQTLAESGLLAFLGGALGILLAWWMIRLLPLFAPRGILREQSLPLDTKVLLFAICTTSLAGIIIAVLPAVRQPWSSLAEAIKRSGGHEATGDRRLFQSVLVSLQIALTLTVLCGAGLMVRSFIALRGGYPGARNEQIIKFEVNLKPKYNFNPDPKFIVEEAKRNDQSFERIRKELEMLPGVKRIAMTTQMPGDTRTGTVPLKSYPGQTSWHVLPTNTATLTNVSPGYFEILRIPLLSGRTFSETDNSRNFPKTVILSQTLAKILFQGENPIGKIYSPMNDAYHRPVIIGVVGDIRNRGFREASFPEVYSPQLNPFIISGAHRMSAVAEARGSARISAESIREAVARIDPEAAVSGIMTMDEYIDSFQERDRFSVFLLSIFALATLAIAAVGIYGVMTQSVEQRLREMAVRIALGATPWQVMRFVFARGAAQIALGLAAGLLGSFFMSRTLGALLVQVKPYDPGTFLSVLFILMAVALLACYGPANRATKADPISVLRAE